MNLGEISIRQEIPADYAEVENLVEEAFKDLEISDHTEQFLVSKLRKSDAFIPELSLVAEIDSRIIGHILLTKLFIINDRNTHLSLSLAPVSVKPAYQNKGVASKLIIHAHKIAKSLGYRSIILVGHEDYYPRFGYKQLHSFEITLPFDAPKKNCFCIELTKGALSHIHGVAKYPKEFFE